MKCIYCDKECNTGYEKDGHTFNIRLSNEQNIGISLVANVHYGCMESIVNEWVKLVLEEGRE